MAGAAEQDGRAQSRLTAVEKHERFRRIASIQRQSLYVEQTAGAQLWPTELVGVDGWDNVRLAASRDPVHH